MLSSSLKRASPVATSFSKNRASPFAVLRQQSNTTRDEISGKSESEKGDSQSSTKNQDKEQGPKKVKTSAQLDEELREKLEAMSGEGGAAGLEYENGKPVAMKRSVRNNMFRLI
ncbi:hypothetical protein VTN00DRAFT_3871 [Thermoascus crustaceus]|uniref:uncharacterized protein n=1 Tax=Thermoascus crustaceus TaxID=5088 RepID=UPI0037442EA6